MSVSASFGQFQSVSVCFGQLWSVMVCLVCLVRFDLFWSVLVSFGKFWQFWSVLVSFGQFWSIWSVLDCFGQFWSFQSGLVILVQPSGRFSFQILSTSNHQEDLFFNFFNFQPSGRFFLLQICQLPTFRKIF